MATEAPYEYVYTSTYDYDTMLYERRCMNGYANLYVLCDVQKRFCTRAVLVVFVLLVIVSLQQEWITVGRSTYINNWWRLSRIIEVRR